MTSGQIVISQTSGQMSSTAPGSPSQRAHTSVVIQKPRARQAATPHRVDAESLVLQHFGRLGGHTIERVASKPRR